ncbi:hypothetical protein GGE06_001398 [Streptomyces sp. SFB5A]|uniref:Uncharacterized protein n=2 Tax=Streptomyces nymphaeiformis TaxID=2663842 RepID=A0A7W7TYW3_9ACTN|nr:hypothetical protein [Streptomyces nymphaeiformis]
MHNMDRTQLEFGYGTGGGTAGEAEAYGAYAPEFEGAAGYGSQEAEGGFDEVREMELAGELLEVGDEAELEQFLGGLIRAAAPLLRGAAGKTLQGLLRGAARQFLPVLGSAAGNLVAPGVGGLIGSQLASKAGSLLGLEVEGLSREDQEFEAARQFVRFAADAARTAAGADGGAGAYGEYEGDFRGEFGDGAGAEFEGAGQEYGYEFEGAGGLAGEYQGEGEYRGAYEGEYEGGYAGEFEGDPEGDFEGVGEADAGAARAAVLSAAQRYAPGLVPLVSGAASAVPDLRGPAAYGGRRSSGRWVRRGRTIILLGI